MARQPRAGVVQLRRPTPENVRPSRRDALCRRRQVDAAPDSEFRPVHRPRTGSNRHILPAGKWQIRLAATLRNGDATFWDADVSWSERTQMGRIEPAEVNATISRAL